MKLPANQTQLVAPAGSPSFILLGVGFQNYTCSNGSYASTGAVAELFDISCLYNTKEFDRVDDAAYKWWLSIPAKVIPKLLSCLEDSSPQSWLGQHYFIKSPTGTGISPKWDFTSTGAYEGNAKAFVVAAREGGIPAPTGPKDVDWLSLKAIQGELATQVFRTDTRGGPAPAKCIPDAPSISVKYVTKYWLYGGTVKK
ncbi:hypothetical protein BD779DRAFT_1511605 [Infundibulicybe gibba]|nr:hypothetical protein BD779DRAFT_1511605 [Infundibulicybe gibba]